MKASQNGKSLEQNGGLDLNKKLTLNIDIRNNYKKNEIPNHQHGLVLYYYGEDEDGRCAWNEADFGLGE
jgi:hypothetical protein